MTDTRTPNPRRCEPWRPVDGDVWEDKDPRGGPTFVVVHTDPDEYGFAYVENMDGKRRRRIRLQRFRNAYRLLTPSSLREAAGE